MMNNASELNRLIGTYWVFADLESEPFSLLNTETRNLKPVNGYSNRNRGNDMKNRLPIRTRRLLLRPYLLSDADDLKRLAGDYDVAKGTLLMPHPYEEGMAEEFIKRQEKANDGEKCELKTTHSI